MVGVLLTFHIVCLGWILFRAESFDLAMHWLPPRAVEGMAERLKTAPSITLGLLIGAAILLVEAVRPEGVAPFIYFQF